MTRQRSPKSPLTVVISPPFPMIAIVASVAVSLAAACGPQTVSLEEAKQITATFKGGSFTPPPKTIADISKLLDEHKEMKPETARRIAANRAAAAEPIPAGLAGIELAEFLLQRGISAKRSAQIGKALADLRRAKDLSEGKPGVTRREILWELASVEVRGGNPKNSARLREEALRMVSNPIRIIGYTAITATTQAAFGDLDAAEATLVQAERHLGQGPNSRAWSRMADNMTYRVLGAKGNVELRKGRYAEAEQLFRSALSTALKANTNSIRDVQNRITARGRLARVLAKQGRHVESEVENRRGVKEALRDFGRYSQYTASRLGSLLNNLIEQGRFDEAEQLAGIVLDTYTKLGVADDSFMVNRARILIADLKVNQAQWADALRLYDFAERKIGDNDYVRDRLITSNLNRVVALLKAGRAAEARDIIQKTVDVRRGSLGAKHYSTAEATGLLGVALATLGERAKALARFREALPILISRSRGAESETESSASRELRLGLILEAYIALLADVAGTPIEKSAGIDAPAEAFRVADIARSRSVQTALAASGARAAAGNADLADLVRREQDARKQISALFGLYANALAAPPDQQDRKVQTALRTRIDSLRGARAALAEEIERRFPDYADLINPKPATVAKVQRIMRPGEALIATYVSDDKTYVWGVPKSGRVRFAAAALDRKSIRAVIRDLRRALDPQAATLGNIPAFDLGLSHRLYRALLEPVKDGWRGAKSLLVVADDALGQLPFSVLVTQRTRLADESGALFSNYKSVPWLARDHAVTALPSVTALATLRALPAANPARRAFVGFGDPYFSTQQAAQAASSKPIRTAALTSRGAFKVRGLPVRLRSAPKTKDLDSAELSKLPRLPDTADEVRGIALAVEADLTKDVFTGKRATEQRVKSLDLSGYKILAFATHGLIPGDLNGLIQPALALSAPEIGGTGGDGLLTMGEILGLKLDADWVVLSACNTAAGDGAGAEAFSGLGRAFFYAGTRALLVSNWPVETTSARALTTDLFRRQAKDSSLTRAQALRQAMLTLMDGRGLVDQGGRTVFSYAHPIFWAPFSLVGDGGGGSAAGS